MIQGKNEMGKPSSGISSWFLVIVGFFISSLIVANIIAVKLVSISGLILPSAVIVFPISYIFGDVLTEVYGYKQARRVIWLGFICNLFVIIVIKIAQVLPPASFWEAQSSYDAILGSTPRILLASFLGYLIGSFSNSYVLAKLKLMTQGKWLWIRTITSTFVGEGLDSLVFITISFLGTVPNSAIPNIVITQWLVKTFYEIVATPITYLVVGFLKRAEGIDVYDTDTNFSPVLVKE